MGKVLVNPGKTEPRIGIEIFQDKDGKLQALVHIVDEGDIIRMDSASINGNHLRMERKNSSLIIEGSLEGDGKTIQAKLLQRGKTFPMLLQRVDSLPVLSKPQTPKPPFPYLEEEVSYRNNEAGIWLAGTLTLPKGKSPFPAALLLAGSGENDRDSVGYGNRPFMVLADYLTRHGYAVLRADKRGCGKSGGVFDVGDLAGFASDALAASPIFNRGLK